MAKDELTAEEKRTRDLEKSKKRAATKPAGTWEPDPDQETRQAKAGKAPAAPQSPKAPSPEAKPGGDS
jgi:hypothetical protein